MRKQLTAIIVLSFLTLALAAPAWSQLMATVKGTVLDQQGQPMQNAKVEYANKENGQKYTLKTDKKGQFFSIGVAFGTYKVTLYGADGKPITNFDNVRVTGQQPENVLDFNLQRMMAEQAMGVTASPQQGGSQKLTPEQQKALEAQQKALAEQQKEVNTVKNLNAMLASAKTNADAGNLDEAIATMKQATAADATRDVLWAVLGDYELRATKKPGTDAATKKQLSTDAADAYQKAIADCNVQKPAPSCKDVASYHNNMGQALAGMGKTDDAIKAYEEAAKLNPAGAGQYYFNEGAILTNLGKTDEANAAFDKAIQADPQRADAYYQKGVNMLAKASVDKEGHMVAPPGTKEAIQKYLDLAPTGPNADSAKQLLEAMGAKIETSFGKSGKKK